MGRPERPLDPQSGPVAELAAQLRELRASAGRPSYAALARRAHLSRTTLSEAAGGQRLPTWETTAGYVTACGGDAAQWRARWASAAASVSAEPSTSEAAEPAATEPAATEPAAGPQRRGWILAGATGMMLGAAALAALIASGAMPFAPAREQTPLAAGSPSPSAGRAGDRGAAPADVPPASPRQLTPVVDGADPKDSGCALDPDVVTLDSSEVDLSGGPVGLAELRYSPMCGVAWPRFEPFPQAVIPTNAMVHTDVVRPGSGNLRLPFQAPYTGVPVYGNVMRSTEQCVYAAAWVDPPAAAASAAAGTGGAAPASRTHCFRGTTPVTAPAGAASAVAAP